MQGKANWKLAGAFQGVQSPSEGGGGCASALLAAAKAAKEDSFSKKDGEGDAHDEVEARCLRPLMPTPPRPRPRPRPRRSCDCRVTCG